MRDLITIVLLFVGSFLVAALLTKRSERGGKSTPLPTKGSRVLLRCNGEAYLCRFLSARTESWQLSAPKKKGIRVPLHVGDSLIIEVGTPFGVAKCEAKLVDRDADRDTIHCSKPSLRSIEERRGSERSLGPIPSNLNGIKATVLDVSETGARVTSLADISVGDAVTLELHGTIRRGWALSVVPALSGTPGDAEVRISLCG